MKERKILSLFLIFVLIIMSNNYIYSTSNGSTVYVCQFKSKESGSDDKKWHNSSDKKYGKRYSYTKYGKKKQATSNEYGLFTSIDTFNQSRCEDRYTPSDEYSNIIPYTMTYNEYSSLYDKGVISSNNTIDWDKVEEAKRSISANDYLEKLKTAYKNIPSNNATAEEISTYINSDIRYNNKEGLKNLTSDKYEAWMKTLRNNMIDAVSRDAYQDKYNLLEEYKNGNTENAGRIEKSVSNKVEETIKANETVANEGNETHGGGGRDFSDDDDYNQCIDGWWNCAWGFLNKGQNSEHQFGGDGVDDALAGIRSMIFDVGNVIFILVTAFLGVKYIWGGVDSKFSVKNSLMTLVVAAIVFYGWNAVTDILDIQELLTGDTSASGVDGFVGVVYNTIMYIINFAAVGGIIYIGIRYMMAGADGKAEMKLKGIPIIMGIIMVYGTVNLINFILKIVEGL